MFVHRYTLRSGAALNAASVRREFPGALVFIDGGYAALHPWPEFGDAPIEQQLQILRAGGSTPLIDRALHCARLDAAARARGESLFANLQVPRSHYSWSQSKPTAWQMDYLEQHGFTALKTKGYVNYGETRGFLQALSKAAPNLKLRVDFNGCLAPGEFMKFLEFMEMRIFRHLDLIEDPVPYDAALWLKYREQFGVKLALDKGWRDATTGFDAVVIKPARRDWRVVHDRHPDRPMMITSAMDHALGQSYAAYEAALAAQAHPELISQCGLCTHHLFENDAFFDRLDVEAGVLQVDRTGTGLGFDDVLAEVEWEPL